MDELLRSGQEGSGGVVPAKPAPRSPTKGASTSETKYHQYRGLFIEK
jgi:hypothetical protein